MNANLLQFQVAKPTSLQSHHTHKLSGQFKLSWVCFWRKLVISNTKKKP